MARKKQPVNSTVQAYRKERKRIQSFIRRAEKRGYIFGENVLPTIPKKITQGSVRRLQKLTAKALYEKALWASPETGEALPARFGKQRAIKEGILKRQGLTPNVIEVNEKIPPISELPQVDLWMDIRKQLVNSFPQHKIYFIRATRRSRPHFWEGEPRLNELLNMWQETYDEADGDLSGLNNYVMTNESEFADALSALIKAVYEDEITESITRIARWLLMGKSMTIAQSEALAEMTEMY